MERNQKLEFKKLTQRKHVEHRIVHGEDVALRYVKRTSTTVMQHRVAV